MEEIESALEALLKRKSSVAEKQKVVETEVAAIEREQTISKQNIAKQVDESKTKIALIQLEIKTAKLSLEEGQMENRGKLDLEKSGGQNESRGNLDLENFLEGQILELEEELECPVCLEVATTLPIYKCLDDHLLCRF